MAESTASIERTYPLPSYNFRVELDGLAMGFTELSGINTEAKTANYRHGLSFLEGEELATFVSDPYRRLTLSRGLVLGSGSQLYRWLETRESRSLEVHLLATSGAPASSWRIARAVPVKIEAPSLKADGNEVAIIRLELMARGISLVEHLQTATES